MKRNLQAIGLGVALLVGFAVGVLGAAHLCCVLGLM